MSFDLTMKFLLGLILLAVLCLSPSNQRSTKPLKVAVYYEAHCDSCSKFITEQLYPSYAIVGFNIQLELIPYGNTNRSFVNGSWQFTCQHGPKECYINKLLACGLTLNYFGQARNLDFAYCVEHHVSYDERNYLQEIVNKCEPILPYGKKFLLWCAQGPEGDEFLAQFGARTDAVSPKLLGVPSIIFNNKNDEAVNSSAIEDFLGTTCKLLDHKPKGCASKNILEQ